MKAGLRAGFFAPIANSRDWSICAELDHEYNNRPEDDVEKRDTSYQLGVVREF